MCECVFCVLAEWVDWKERERKGEDDDSVWQQNLLGSNDFPA